LFNRELVSALEFTISGSQDTVKNENIFAVVPVPKRADALDALRGLAVLAMVLSGTMARKILPAWMYHAQEPPPIHAFNPKLAGLTWVDLVFPFFLFAMGAAIPLALSRRIARGWDLKKVIGSILQRGFLLGSFAIFLQHIRPTVIDPNEPGPHKWWLGICGFFILFFMFVRWPTKKFLWLRITITIAAWSAGIGFISRIKYPNGIGFDLNRSDIILIVLANMAVFGSMIWLFTRSNIWLRVGFLGFVLAMRLASGTDGWIKLIWFYSPEPALFQFDYWKYLFIVIPGTIVGDLLCRWIEYSSPEEASYAKWKNPRYFGIMILMFAVNLVLLIGLQARWVWQTTLVMLVLGLCGLVLLSNPGNVTENLLNRLYKWGFYWLALGLLFEPYEGGIKKDSATMSYFFVTTGMAIFLLIGLTVIMDVFQKKRFLQLFVDNGLNPMIGYAGFANIVWPIVVLTGWEPAIIEMTATDPFMGFLRGFGYTAIVALIVVVFTRLKLFLRT
jgi:predicted acyltransferase